MRVKISTNTQSALADETLQKNLRRASVETLDSRNQAVSEVPNWEELRHYARTSRLTPCPDCPNTCKVWKRRYWNRVGR